MTPKTTRARRGTPQPRKRPQPDLLLFALLALALGLRLWGVSDRLPDPTLGVNPIVGNTAVDEGDRRAMDVAWRMWRGGAVPLDLNPKTGDWPGLPFYLTLKTQVLYRAYDSLAHGADTTPFGARMERDPRGMFHLARILDALVGTLTVLLVYLIGRTLAGRSLGLIAAAILALNPFHILSSQRVWDPNLLALLFLLLATLALVREPSVKRSAFAGAMTGLAAACKYIPIVFLAIVALANVERRQGTWRVRVTSIAAATIAAIVAFFITSPYTFLDWTNKSRSFAMQRGRLLNEWVGLTRSPFSLPTYLTSTFPGMLGWPAYFLAIAGLVLLFAKRPRGWIVAATPILLLLPTGSMALAQERFMLPALGALVLAAAFALTRLREWKGRAPAIALLALAVAWSLPSYVRTRQALHRPDTRTLANRWITTNIPPQEPMAIEVYGPEFAETSQRNGLIWPFLATQAAYVRGAYNPAWLDGLRYYVASSEVGRRFEAAAARYPVEAGFRRWLAQHGRVVWSSESSHASGPTIEVRALPDSISTRAEREAAWAEVVRAPMYAQRLQRWCLEMATLFRKVNRFDDAVEWAARGLTIPNPESRQALYGELVVSQVRDGQLVDAETNARSGLREFPSAALIHVGLAMALEQQGRAKEAIAEYGNALRLGRNPVGNRILQAEIDRLQRVAR